MITDKRRDVRIVDEHDVAVALRDLHRAAQDAFEAASAPDTARRSQRALSKPTCLRSRMTGASLARSSNSRL